MNNEAQNLNIDLSPDNIYGYIFTTQNYSEEDDDKRKKPIFFWKGYHMYPIVVEDTDDVDYEDDDLDPDKVKLLICTEGGDTKAFNYVPMTATQLRSFLRNNPSFRMFRADDLFENLNVI